MSIGIKSWKKIRRSAAALAILFLSVTPFNPAARATAPEAQAQVLPDYSVRGTTILAGETPITLKGVSWFGFDTPTHVVNGLWARSLPDTIAQMQSLGINAVRLPICPESLTPAAVTSVDYTRNPQLKGLDSRQTLYAVSKTLSDAHLYVLLDFHSADCRTISPLWYAQNYSETQWISDLESATKLLATLPYFVGIDLHNEPYGATWGTGNPATDWNSAAERAGSAVLAVDPRILVVTEGVWENPTCSSSYNHFWGEDLEPIRCTPLHLPLNKSLLSAHVFGTDISTPSYYRYPSDLNTVWDTQFGTIAAQQPVVIGEWGGKMGTDGGTSGDLTIQKELVNYLNSRSICNGFYWSWGPNSADTGGLLQDDWQTPWPVKQQVLQSYFSGCK